MIDYTKYEEKYTTCDYCGDMTEELFPYCNKEICEMCLEWEYNK